MTDHAARPRTWWRSGWALGDAPAVLAPVFVLENRDPASSPLLVPVGLLLRRRG